MMIQMLGQKNAGYSTAEGEILLFNDDTREILTEIAKHARSRAFSTFKISSYPGNWFNAGQCIFAVDSTAGATWMGTDAPLLDIPEEELVEFETVVLPVPQFDPANPKMISQGPSVCVFYKDDPQEVLASWLFTQFLLTNSVQIPYAETEGYVPVTLKARQDPGYQDYLDRAGEDNREHYRTKIDATRLLLENTENTFTTPVFRGSPSVRDAAGTLIESVCKSERAGKTVDTTLLNKIFSETRSLYQLDQIQAEHIDTSAPLPAAALALLATLAAVWVLIGLVSGYSALKRKRAKEKS
jgi:multiple sugar transport system substrate-binding protein